MFDNRKIKQIRHLPEGNNIVLIWVMLLTAAGRCNAGGMIFLTENIPYTIESLSVEFEFDPTVVKLALDILQKFGMIICNEEEFRITNWEEYQNIEGMEKIREQNRIRQKKWYDKRQALDEPNVRPNVSLTSTNATDKDIDKEIRSKNIDIYKAFADGDSDLLDALKEFESYRKLKKKPLTDNAKERLVNRLKKFPREEWVDILHQSIDKGWADIYQLKKGDGNESIHGSSSADTGKSERFADLPDL